MFNIFSVRSKENTSLFVRSNHLWWCEIFALFFT